MTAQTVSGEEASPASAANDGVEAGCDLLRASLLDAALNLRAQLVWLAENGEDRIPKAVPQPRLAEFQGSPGTSFEKPVQSASAQASRNPQNASSLQKNDQQQKILAPAMQKAPASAVPQVSVRSASFLQPSAVSASAGRAHPPIASSVEELLEKVRTCELCPMRKSGGSILVGNGVWRSDLMLVGERPSAAAGSPPRLFEDDVYALLEKMIRAIGRDIGKIACVDAIQCASAGELPFQAPQACRPLLWTAVSLVQPKVIISLGKVATQALLDVATPITRMRGIWQNCGGVRIMPTYHPAYLLKHAEAKREAWEDLKQVRAVLDG